MTHANSLIKCLGISVVLQTPTKTVFSYSQIKKQSMSVAYQV